MFHRRLQIHSVEAIPWCGTGWVSLHPQRALGVSNTHLRFYSLPRRSTNSQQKKPKSSKCLAVVLILAAALVLIKPVEKSDRVNKETVQTAFITTACSPHRTSAQVEEEEIKHSDYLRFTFLFQQFTTPSPTNSGKIILFVFFFKSLTVFWSFQGASWKVPGRKKKRKPWIALNQITRSKYGGDI